MQDEKKWGDKTQDKKWGDKTQDKKAEEVGRFEVSLLTII